MSDSRVEEVGVCFENQFRQWVMDICGYYVGTKWTQHGFVLKAKNGRSQKDQASNKEKTSIEEAALKPSGCDADNSSNLTVIIVWDESVFRLYVRLLKILLFITKFMIYFPFPFNYILQDLV